MEQETQSNLMSLLPLLIMTLPLGIAARMLAKEKGRNVTRWTVLGFIPIVNYFCLFFFIGAANLRLEKKIDQLLERLNSGKPL